MLTHNCIAYFWKLYQTRRVALFACLLLAGWTGLHSLFNAYLTKLIIDLVSCDELTIKQLVLPAVLFIGNYELHNLCWRGINLINLRLTPVIKNKMIQDLFNHVHTQSYQFFQETLSGSIAGSISLLGDHLEKIANNTVVRLMRGCFQFIASLIVMGSIHLYFALSFFLWTVFFLSFSLFFSKKVRFFSKRVAANHSLVSGRLVDSITNAPFVRIFSQKDYEASFLQRSLHLLKKSQQKKDWFLLKFYFIQGFSITCLIGFIIFLLFHLKISGKVTTGDFAFVLGASLYLTDMVWANTELIDQLNDAIGKCNQSLKIIFRPIEPSEREHAKPLVIQKGEIIFNSVDFHFHAGSPLFIDKSLIIPAGQKVGIVGHSGSGKSTFINLLLRFYDVKKGAIFIDKQDIRDVTQDSLNKAIGVIPQEPFLFHRSLMDNIRYGNINASDEEVELAAKKALIDEFIMNLKGGYHAFLGEKGVKLSGGQRQRIAFARIILKNPPILILDEPTSQLDSLTEERLKDSLFSLIKGKTTIVISHRLSTLSEMDRILVFDHGKIVEDGSPDSLLRRGGLYAAFYETGHNPEIRQI